MISDVLFEAVRAIESYEKNLPEMYDSLSAEIAEVKASMNKLRERLDTPSPELLKSLDTRLDEAGVERISGLEAMDPDKVPDCVILKKEDHGNGPVWIQRGGKRTRLTGWKSLDEAREVAKAEKLPLAEV